MVQLCPTLCDLMDCIQSRILEWVAVPFSGESSQSRDGTQVSCIAGRFFTSRATREPWVGMLSFLELIFVRV